MGRTQDFGILTSSSFGKENQDNACACACVGSVFRPSKDNSVPQRRVVKKEEHAKLIKNHEIDNRRPDAFYESIRRSIFPVVWENVQLWYKQEVLWILKDFFF